MQFWIKLWLSFLCLSTWIYRDHLTLKIASFLHVFFWASLDHSLRSKGLFLMEALWTRFFPIVRKLRELLKGGTLGVPRCLQADFGFVGPTDPSHRLLDPAQAGGAMLDIDIYVVQLATMTFGTSIPEIKSSAILTPQGVDAEGALTLTWKDTASASLLFTIRACTPENSVIMCDKGYVRIHGQAHCPERMTVSRASTDRGKFVNEEFSFPLPKLKQVDDFGKVVEFPPFSSLFRLGPYGKMIPIEK